MTKKQLTLAEMNAPEYRKHLQQQAFELRFAAVKATGDPQATILHATEGAQAKATEIFEAPLVAKADERRVTPETVGSVEAKPQEAKPQEAKPQEAAPEQPKK